MHHTAVGQCFHIHPPKHRQNPVVYSDRTLIHPGGQPPVPLGCCGVLLCADADPSIRWSSPSGRRDKAAGAAAGAPILLLNNVLVSQAKSTWRTGPHAGLPAVGLRL